MSTSAASSPRIPVYRKRNLYELQPYLFAYSAVISAVSPVATLYQLLRINPELRVPVTRMASLSACIFPIQTILKAAQMNVMSPIKENFNVWAGFGVMGTFH